MRKTLLFVLCSLLFCVSLPIRADGEISSQIVGVSLRWDGNDKKFVLQADPASPALTNVTPASLQEIPLLAERLSATDITVSVLAMLRLSRSGDRAVAALHEVVKWEGGIARGKAAAVLLAIGTKSAFAAVRNIPLKTLQADIDANDGLQRFTSGLLLAFRGGKEANEIVRAMLRNDDYYELHGAVLLGAAVGHQKALLPDIEQCLRSTDAQTRMQAVFSYGVLRGRKAEEKLLALLPDPDPTVRIAVVAFLSGMHSDCTYETLISVLLFDAEPSIRALAVVGLNSIRNPKAIPYLVRASHDGEASVRANVAGTLRNYPPSEETITTLRALQKDEDEKVRTTATESLVKLNK